MHHFTSLQTLILRYLLPVLLVEVDETGSLLCQHNLQNTCRTHRTVVSLDITLISELSQDVLGQDLSISFHHVKH
jgi:hypothetical protein